MCSFFFLTQLFLKKRIESNPEFTNLFIQKWFKQYANSNRIETYKFKFVNNSKTKGKIIITVKKKS